MTAEPLRREHIESQALALPDQARRMTIVTDEDFQSASTFLRVDCKAVLKRIGEFFDPIISKAHATHKEAVAKKKLASEPVIEAEKIIKGQIAAHARKKEEERLKAEAVARRKAQELAEKEALERAAQLETEGHQEEAEAIIEEPIKAQPVIVTDPAPKAEGVSMRKAWKFRITDPSKINAKFLMPDEKKIGQVVRSMKEEAAEIIGEGIEVYSEDVVSARA